MEGHSSGPRLEGAHAVYPSVDDLAIGELAEVSDYEVETADGWTLIVTRYRPIKQNFPQPLLNVPLLLTHGFGANRLLWTHGEFVKDLAYFGIDLHILEFRGHGKSSISLQYGKVARGEKRAPPKDIHYEWDLDSYFIYDIPAAIEAVKARSGYKRIFYCGHSMGGMLGYGLAGKSDDLMGLVAIGSPSDVGRGIFYLPMRLFTYLQHVSTLERFAALNFLAYDTARYIPRKLKSLVTHEEVAAPQLRRGFYVPLDDAHRFFRHYRSHRGIKLLRAIARRFGVPVVNIRGLQAYLSEAAEREPLRALDQWGRWLRKNEIKCYRSGYDFKKGFHRITIPLAIIFGDSDFLANVDNTRSIYHAARSNYLLWRPVRGNSHIELTMGYDVRQICYDIKNLMDYALKHQQVRPSLPRERRKRRRRAGASVRAIHSRA